MKIPLYIPYADYNIHLSDLYMGTIPKLNLDCNLCCLIAVAVDHDRGLIHMSFILS